jgi:uncharacterized damage-inducible protein DinB
MNNKHATTLARYNQWMNQNIYRCADDIDDEIRKQDKGAFFASIHGTLNHLLLGDMVWMGRFTGDPISINTLSQELYSDYDELKAARVEFDDVIIDWVATLNDDDFVETLHYRGITSPGEKSTPMWFAVTHFFNHQTHHRGQITTLLSQMGIDPGCTDLIALSETTI